MQQTTRPSLGERLKQSQQAAAAAESAEKLALQQQDAESRADLACVRKFFKAAQQGISQQIGAGSPQARVQLGDSGRHEGGGEKFVEAARLLRSFGVNGALDQEIRKPQHPFHAQWQQMQAWAAQNELKLSFEYCWDGGGMYSWYELQASPAI